MKIQVVNDLHLEFGHWPELPVCGEVLTVAGDLCTWTNIYEGINWLNEQAKKFAHVFVVPGNHEYYGGQYQKVRRYWTAEIEKDLAPNAICLAGPSIYKYKGVGFIGDTLWTDLKNNDPLAKLMFQNHMMDTVKCLGLTADVVIDENQYTKEDIEGLIHHNLDIPIVLITHHLPFERAIAPQWKGDHLNPAFANYDNWAEALLHWGNIKMWHFGHTHTPTRFTHKECEFVCNPFGYYKYEETNFNNCEIVEI